MWLSLHWKPRTSGGLPCHVSTASAPAETTKITVIAKLYIKVAIGRMILRTLIFLLNLFTVVDWYNDFANFFIFLLRLFYSFCAGSVLSSRRMRQHKYHLRGLKVVRIPRYFVIIIVGLAYNDSIYGDWLNGTVHGTLYSQYNDWLI